MVNVKVDASLLGRKSKVTLTPTIKTVKKVLSYRASLTDLDKEVEKVDKDDYLGFMIADNQRAIKLIDLQEEMLKDILNLNAKEIKKLEEIQVSDLYELSATVTNKVLNPFDDKEQSEGKPSKA